MVWVGSNANKAISQEVSFFHGEVMPVAYSMHFMSLLRVRSLHLQHRPRSILDGKGSIRIDCVERERPDVAIIGVLSGFAATAVPYAKR